MTDENKQKLPWVTFKILGEAYAISCHNVISLNALGPIIYPPNRPKEVRGMIKFREHVIELLDLRSILGFITIDEEFKAFDSLMDARLNDHVNWLEKLKKIVLNDLEFDLITDPHKCAFGKWYDSYDLKSSSIMFQSVYAKFDKPHKRIHNIAISAQNLIQQGQKQDAIDLVNATKDNELQQMIKLFSELKEAFRESKKEIVIVLGSQNKNISFSVDEVLSIEYLSDFDEKFLRETITDSEYLNGIAKRKDGSAVILVDDEYLIQNF